MSHVVLLANFWHYFFGITLTLTAIFLILLVLVQRGRGGGLAGAFGGMGGQSAFGTKAGDMFTRVTIGVSLFWILMCVAAVRFLGSPASGSFGRAVRAAGNPNRAVGACGSGRNVSTVARVQFARKCGCDRSGWGTH